MGGFKRKLFKNLHTWFASPFLGVSEGTTLWKETKATAMAATQATMAAPYSC
jgi:hypothetical protein